MREKFKSNFSSNFYQIRKLVKQILQWLTSWKKSTRNSRIWWQVFDNWCQIDDQWKNSCFDQDSIIFGFVQSFYSLLFPVYFFCHNPTWVSELFSTDPAHFKSKGLIQFWNIASPAYFKFLYVQYFFIMIILRSESSPMLNLYFIFWKLLIPKNKS